MLLRLIIFRVCGRCWSNTVPFPRSYGGFPILNSVPVALLPAVRGVVVAKVLRVYAVGSLLTIFFNLCNRRGYKPGAGLGYYFFSLFLILIITIYINILISFFVGCLSVRGRLFLGCFLPSAWWRFGSRSVRLRPVRSYTFAN